MNKILGLTTIALWSFLFYICIWSPSGPHRSVSEVSGRKQSSACAGGAQRSRMPHWGRHRQVTGGGQSGFPEEILNVSMTNFGQRI